MSFSKIFDKVEYELGKLGTLDALTNIKKFNEKLLEKAKLHE